MCQHQALKILNYHRGLGDGSVVIMSFWLSGHRDDGGGLETWPVACLQGGVEDFGEIVTFVPFVGPGSLSSLKSGINITNNRPTIPIGNHDTPHNVNCTPSQSRLHPALLLFPFWPGIHRVKILSPPQITPVLLDDKQVMCT